MAAASTFDLSNETKNKTLAQVWEDRPAPRALSYVNLREKTNSIEEEGDYSSEERVSSPYFKKSRTRVSPQKEGKMISFTSASLLAEDHSSHTSARTRPDVRMKKERGMVRCKTTIRERVEALDRRGEKQTQKVKHMFRVEKKSESPREQGADTR